MLFRINGEKGILQLYRFYGKVLENDEPIKWVYEEKEIITNIIETIESLIKSNILSNRKYEIDFDKTEKRYNIYENILFINGIEGSYLDAFQSLWDDEKKIKETSLDKVQLLKLKAQGGIIFKSNNEFTKNLYEGSITAEDGEITCFSREFIDGKQINKKCLEPSSIRWNVVFNKNPDIDNAIKWLNTFRENSLKAILEKKIWEPNMAEKEINIWK